MASAKAEIVSVCQNGCDYSSLHEAVNAALDGDTISMQSGTYQETVNLSKRLILRGMDTGNGKPLLVNNSSIIAISANRSIIRGFNLSGPKEACIKILSWGNTLLENDLRDNAIGISIQSGEK